MNVLIFGIGNLVQSDDGFGPHVIRALMKEEDSLPEGTVLLDAGTSIVDQLSDVSKADHLICVDVVEGGGEPGTIYKFAPADVTYKTSKFHHAHKISIFDTLKMVEQMEGRAPKTTIIAVQPDNIDWGTELTEPVANSLPKVLELIHNELDSIHSTAVQ